MRDRLDGMDKALQMFQVDRDPYIAITSIIMTCPFLMFKMLIVSVPPIGLAWMEG